MNYLINFVVVLKDQITRDYDANIKGSGREFSCT